jgi:hypothetical protein
MPAKHRTSSLLLSARFESTRSFAWPFPAVTPVSAAESDSDSRHFSVAMILGIVGGVLAFAGAIAIGFVLVRFRRSKNLPILRSDDGSGGDDTTESTLQQTLLPLGESVTIDGREAAPILTFSSTLHSISSFA